MYRKKRRKKHKHKNPYLNLASKDFKVNRNIIICAIGKTLAQLGVALRRNFGWVERTLNELFEGGTNENAVELFAPVLEDPPLPLLLLPLLLLVSLLPLLLLPLLELLLLPLLLLDVP
jgi:hypothetical protein